MNKLFQCVLLLGVAVVTFDSAAMAVTPQPPHTHVAHKATPHRTLAKKHPAKAHMTPHVTAMHHTSVAHHPAVSTRHASSATHHSKAHPAKKHFVANPARPAQKL